MGNNCGIMCLCLGMYAFACCLYSRNVSELEALVGDN